MSKALSLALVVVPLAAGCDADCDDAGRANATWAMFHQILNAPPAAALDAGKAEATMSENYVSVSYGIFANGWSRWDVTRNAGSGTASIVITDAPELQGEAYPDGIVKRQQFDDQPMKSVADNCNVFELDLSGDYPNPAGTTHTFEYKGTLTFLGDHLSGEFSYSDTFTGAPDGGAEDSGGADVASGSIDGAVGEVTGTRSSADKFDTGFGG